MSQPGRTIVLAEPFEDSAVRRLQAHGRVIVLERCDELSLQRALRKCDALLIRTYARVTENVLSAADRLRVIGRAGVGMDNVDLHAAAKRNITVVYTPAASTDAVADLTVGLILDLLRGVTAGDGLVRGGRFREARELLVGHDLYELTVGIIGMGRIGRAVGRRLRNGFRPTVLFNDVVSPGHLDFVAAPVSKEELFQRSDIITLHVPLTELTRNMMNETTLAQCKPGAMLVNTARGAVVDAAALSRALGEGRIGGAALDVFDPEPPPQGHPLLSAPNAILTPHIGARTREGLSRMNDVVEDVIRVLEGKAPLFPAVPMDSAP